MAQVLIAEPLAEAVVTPHLGASTAEAQDKAGMTIAEQLLLALAGQFVPNAVNVDAGPVPDALRPFLPLVEKLGRLYTAFVTGASSARRAVAQPSSPAGTITVEFVGGI